MGRLQAEIHQGPQTRQQLISALEDHFQRRIVTFFTSFRFPAQIADEDADSLEGILQKTDLSNGLALVVNSAGGNGLTVERIIRICRTYAGGEFSVIVPKMAKSAATVICLGASCIYMAQTAELGPVAPQVFRRDPDTGEMNVAQAQNIIKSYEKLITSAVRVKGNPDPYLQQLQRYDATDIQELRDAVALAEDLALTTLSTGMMQGKSRASIRKCIAVLLDPEKTSAHGRPVYLDQARACGLKIEEIGINAEIWPVLHELYIRTNAFVSIEASKAIETREHAFFAPAPDRPKKG